ncbi:MAG: Glycoprotease family [Candidatus Woesebacteria bacterium GW2011_GWB1_43_14]|uniref:Glycoprotease family n=1 Tax=Candidatus Woesebacteria bacterium GW2011_GWB1_43_14 TaxID=1618578 RepID=A0A0G1FQI9_9BACT|nr:MAG: Glycoprotease family [Candidatus Woesebacteria bacterium GW2011_GWA1_39_11b]KKS77520.1 MAG: Inactive metal-dependent protease-like protein [Candidatus Woesebacteria bacterium GW2011_GWC1_42_9]KKS97301.1 MAG: Glycoprotease family [Candidatus Woesebacteria bacterium GW2011_GWB1_43_14]
MKLYIDTSDSDKSQKPLETIDKTLKKQGKTAHDISEIEINEGPGSFTGLRIGAAIANALGWALKIPVNGQDVSKKPITPKYK